MRRDDCEWNIEQANLGRDLRALAEAVPHREEFRRELRRQLTTRATVLDKGNQIRRKNTTFIARLRGFASGIGRPGGILGRRLTLQKLMVLTLVFAIGLAAFLPPVRAQVAALFRFERQEALPPLLVRVLARAPWDTPEGKSFEILTFDILQERWRWVERSEEQGFSVPEPGSYIERPNGGVLPVPAYLPEGYRWQGVLMQGGRSPFLSLASQSGAGGGDSLAAYERDIASYLIGGDREDHLLVLAQFKKASDAGLLFQAYHVVAPARVPSSPAGEISLAQSDVPTPTPPPAYYGAKTQVGMVVETAGERDGLVFLVGPGEVHETSVAGALAWWYRGTWNAAGEWVQDETLSLIWETDDLTYQLTGQELSLAELLRIAESTE